MAAPRKTATTKAPAKKAAPRKAAPAKITPAVIDELESIQATDDPDALRAEAAKLRKLAGELNDPGDLIDLAEAKEAAAKAIDGYDVDDFADDEPEEDFSDIPEEFRFTTADGERKPDTVPILINGRRFELTEVSGSALFILAARITREESPIEERTLAMLDLVRKSLGPIGYQYLYQQLMDPYSNFDDDELGRMAMKIIELWGTVTPKNRAEKRRIARETARAKK